MSPEIYYLFAGLAGLLIGVAVMYVWADAALRSAAADRASSSAPLPPRPWIVDYEGCWWMPCEGGGYVSTHDTRPPSAYSYDQILSEVGIRYRVPGGPTRLEGPPEDETPVAPERENQEAPVPARLGEFPSLSRSASVSPPEGFDRES